MSKKPKLGDITGIGEKMEEKLRAAGVKTPVSLSKADATKLAGKVDGLSVAGAEKIIAAAKELVPAAPAKEKAKPAKAASKKEDKPKPTPKKKAKAEAPKTKKAAEKKTPAKKPAEKKPAKKAEKEVKPKKPKKKEPEPEFTPVELPYDKRLFRIAASKKKRKPKFRHEQAHRWIRVSDSWRKVRGIDSATREKRKGRIAMVNAGYRSPKAVRGLHPSGYVEAMVHRPADLEGLDPDLHAVRISSSVGMKKRQDILDQAEMKMFKILNPGAPEAIDEEDLFEGLDDLDDLDDMEDD